MELEGTCGLPRLCGNAWHGRGGVHSSLDSRRKLALIHVKGEIHKIALVKLGVVEINDRMKVRIIRAYLAAMEAVVEDVNFPMGAMSPEDAAAFAAQDVMGKVQALLDQESVDVDARHKEMTNKGRMRIAHSPPSITAILNVMDLAELDADDKTEVNTIIGDESLEALVQKAILLRSGKLFGVAFFLLGFTGWVAAKGPGAVVSAARNGLSPLASLLGLNGTLDWFRDWSDSRALGEAERARDARGGEESGESGTRSSEGL